VFAVAFVLQAWSNGYFLYFLAVPAAMTAAHGLWTCRAAWRQRAAGLVAAAVAILLALAPVAAAYLRVRREHGFRRSLADLVQYSAVPYSFVTVSPDLWWWGRVLPEAVAERALFPGLVVLALALLGVWTAARKRNLDAADRTVVWLYAAIVALAVSLSFGPQPALWGTWRLPTGPYAWAAAVVPGMDGLRVPARVGVVVALGLSLLAAFGARAIGARAGTPGVRTALFAGMAGLLYLEGLPVPVQPTAVPTSDMEHDAAAYQWLRAQPSGAVIEMPVGAPEHETRYVYATLAHGHRSVNGYSGYGTALHEFLSGPPTREPASAPALLALLRQLGVRYVVFHGELYGDAAFAETVRNALLEASAASAVPGTTTTFGATDIFEVRGAAPRPPPEAPAPQGCRLPSRAFSLDASDNREALERLVDGVRGSRWLTGRPQRGDEWISVTLDRSRVVTGVRLVMDRYSFGDYPRGLLLEGSANGVAFAPLWSGSGLGPLGLSLGSSPHAPRIDLRFPPAEVRALRLRQTGATPRVWFWSIHELEVWADACE
jgi:hypothetical protein